MFVAAHSGPQSDDDARAPTDARSLAGDRRRQRLGLAALDAGTGGQAPNGDARDSIADGSARDALAEALAESAVSAGSAHPLTRRLYAQMRDRSLSDKRLVFEALNRRLGVECTSAKQEAAYADVSVFVELNGYVPSPKEWEHWRKSPEAPNGLRSMTFIRNAFGDWPAVRSAFYLVEAVPTADALAHHELLSRGPDFADWEPVHIVRLWAMTVSGPLYQHDLLRWCREEAPAHPDIVRAPTDWGTFRRATGGWKELLLAADLWHRVALPDDAFLRRAAAASRRRRHRAGTTLRPKNRSSSETRTQPPVRPQPSESIGYREQLLEVFRRWADEHGGVLIKSEFVAYLCSAQDGLHPRTASFEAYQVEFGGWLKMLTTAGYAHRSARADAASTQAVRLKAPPNAPAVPHGATVEPLFRWLRRAARTYGPIMSYPDYDQWRVRLLHAAVRHGRQMPVIPCSSFFRSRCGSWLDAKAKAGVLTNEELADQPDRSHHRRSQLIQFVFLAMLEHGPAATDDAYDAWRDDYIRSLRLRGERTVRVPRSEFLRLRFGGQSRAWAITRATVLAELDEQQLAALNSSFPALQGPGS